MRRAEAIKKYAKEVEVWKLSQYKDADKTFTVNDDDPDLIPITISLPEPPPWHLIAGFGKKAKDQKFEKVEMPIKLSNLVDETQKILLKERRALKNKVLTKQDIIDEVWNVLEERQVEFKFEINWIKEQIWFIHHGYWCFINGKPTYIDGWHFRYLNYWDMTDANVEYRDRDRRFFLFAKYIYTCTEDEKGNDTGFRTFFGIVYPKHRRDGATHKALNIVYDIMTSVIGEVVGGIQSFDDDNAGTHYKNKLIPAFKNMPFFLKPVWKGSQAPQTELHFSRVDNSIGPELGTMINYATTAAKKFYDGKKLYAYLSDEDGKTILENVYIRWGVAKQTMAQGAGAKVVGFAIHPTTVADMKAGGGENFYNLCKDSQFYDRNALTGQTKTGLAVIYMPAYDGLEGFVGPYGESVIDDPTPEQAAFTGRPYGAKQYIQSQLDELAASGSPDDMLKYRELQRLFPQKYMDCFRDRAGEAGLDIVKIDAAIERLRKEAMDKSNPPTVTGDFKWLVDGVPNPLTAKEFLACGYDRLKGVDMRVEWFPNPMGRWKVSKILQKGESNQKFKSDEIYYPTIPNRFTTGVDPFQFLKEGEANKNTERSRLSKGGIAVFWERDKQLDPDSKNISDWDSYRFICTYNNRTDDDDEFAEHALMTCVYYGSEAFPEQNIKLIWKHFIKRGYGGYLKYGFDEVTGKVRDYPGFYSLTESKQDLFNAIKRYIYHHSTREKHIDFLQQCRDIQGLEYMTKYDLFVGAGGALLGSQSVVFENDSADNETIPDISSVFPSFEYN